MVLSLPTTAGNSPHQEVFELSCFQLKADIKEVVESAKQQFGEAETTAAKESFDQLGTADTVLDGLATVLGARIDELKKEFDRGKSTFEMKKGMNTLKD